MKGWAGGFGGFGGFGSFGGSRRGGSRDGLNRRSSFMGVSIHPCPVAIMTPVMAPGMAPVGGQQDGKQTSSLFVPSLPPSNPLHPVFQAESVSP